MSPNRRRPCEGRYRSAISDQNTDTTNKLKTLVHTKNTRPTQTACAGSTARKTTKKAIKFRMRAQFPLKLRAQE
jgi:hypothetical protein